MIILLITPNTLDIYGTIYTLACRHGEITAGPRIHHSQCGRHSPCALREGPFEVAGNLSGSSGSSGTKNLCRRAKANSHVLLAGDFKGWLEVHGPSTESGYKKGTWTFWLLLVASHTGHGFAILKTWDLEGILRQPEVLARFFSMHLRTIYVTGKDGLRSRLEWKTAASHRLCICTQWPPDHWRICSAFSRQFDRASTGRSHVRTIFASLRKQMFDIVQYTLSFSNFRNSLPVFEDIFPQRYF